jgi:hypothetical protein
MGGTFLLLERFAIHPRFDGSGWSGANKIAMVSRVTTMLRRTALRLLRWLGIGRSPVVGISYNDRFVVAASVQADDRHVRAVSVVELDPSTVVSGAIERPNELALALGGALDALQFPAGTSAAACIPVGIDHRGPEWPTSAEPAGPGDHRTVVVEVAQSAGLNVQAVVPVAVVGARLGELAASSGPGDDGQRGPVSVVVCSGWLSAVVTTAIRHCESRTERNDLFQTPPDVRWGVLSDKAGSQIDPFSWPKPTRHQRQIAILAAGAAMVA